MHGSKEKTTCHILIYFVKTHVLFGPCAGFIWVISGFFHAVPFFSFWFFRFFSFVLPVYAGVLGLFHHFLLYFIRLSENFGTASISNICSIDRICPRHLELDALV